MIAPPIPLPRWYPIWEKWREAGARKPRPKGLPWMIPPWAWVKFKQDHPPKPKVDPFAQLGLPLLYTTEPGSGVKFAARAAASGFKSLGLQVKFATADDYIAVRAAGLKVHAWGIADDGDQAWPTTEISGPQIEGPGQSTTAHALMPSLPVGRRGIVTNFGGVPFELPPDCFTAVECFAVEGNPAIYADLARMTWQALAYGLPNPFPVPECIRGIGIELYPQLVNWVPYFGMWRAEQLPEKTWDQVKALLSSA